MTALLEDAERKCIKTAKDVSGLESQLQDQQVKQPLHKAANSQSALYSMFPFYQIIGITILSSRSSFRRRHVRNSTSAAAFASWRRRRTLFRNSRKRMRKRARI